MFTSTLDSWLANRALKSRRKARAANASPLAFSMIDSSAGQIRCVDSGGQGPVVVFVPDGPNVIEHYQQLIDQISQTCRVICFDMPGFGFSIPSPDYSHSLREGAATVISVLDYFEIDNATLAFSCANGFYALRAAAQFPGRICGLVLSQTPSMIAMHAWTARIVPWPLKIPVIGQITGWLFRERAAVGWYRAALPRSTDATSFRNLARASLRCGGCFSLAGVVQGLLKEADAKFDIASVPCTLFWGKQDRSHRLTNSLSLLDVVPHAEVIELEVCGHFPDLEAGRRYTQILAARVSVWSQNRVNAFVIEEELPKCC